MTTSNYIRYTNQGVKYISILDSHSIAFLIFTIEKFDESRIKIKNWFQTGIEYQQLNS